jgi:hypothetical protein
MGGHDDGNAGLIQAQEVIHDGGSRGGIEIAGGFIHEEEVGREGDGAGNGDALHFAAGEETGRLVGVGLHVHLGKSLLSKAACLVGGGIQIAEPEEDIFQDGSMGEEAEALEDHPDPAFA